MSRISVISLLCRFFPFFQPPGRETHDRNLSSWLAVSRRSAAHRRAMAARQAADSPLRDPARCGRPVSHPRQATASSARHNPRSVVPRTSGTACRTPAWPGIVAVEGSHPDTASSGCTTCPAAHCHWRRRCRELQAVQMSNLV